MALALAACGGGGGGSTAGGGGPVVVTPTSPAPSSPSPTDSPTSSYVPAAAAEPSTGIRLPLGKCVNMANHLEGQPDEGAWGRAIAEDDFTIIKAAGFDSVRLPAWFSGHALATAPYTIDAAFMARVHHVVDLATAAGLNIIIDMHNFDELFSDPSANNARFAEMWRQIGAEFAAAPDSVWFELINEPHGSLNNANLVATMSPALAAVRATNATRPVIIGGQDWSGIGSLATLEMPNDPNVVPTFHYYDPFYFTHQGATWVTPAPPLGVTFGSATDLSELNANLQRVRDYIARTGRVPFIGEYGAIDHPDVPLAQRIKYYRTVSSAYASIGIQSCAWGYTNTFRLRDGSAWLPGMVEAISTTTNI